MGEESVADVQLLLVEGEDTEVGRAGSWTPWAQLGESGCPGQKLGVLLPPS